MSYAAVAAHNAPASSAQPHPDLSLLETDISHEVSADTQEHGEDEKVHLVTEDEADKLRHAIAGDLPQESQTAHFERAKKQTESALRPQKAKPATASVGSSASTNDAAHKTSERVSKAEKEVKETAAEVEQKGKQLYDEAGKKVDEGIQKGKEYYGKAEEQVNYEYKEGKKAAKEYYDKAEDKAEELTEEAKAEAKKLKKKAGKLEREARATVKKYPAATTGLVGIVNFAILATVGIAAYQNWDKPSWDRRTVTMTTIGLLGFFGAEGYLGYYEYEKDQVDPATK